MAHCAGAPVHRWFARRGRRSRCPRTRGKDPGARYRIALDPPLQSNCLALVLDTAFDTSKTAKVSVAELSVISELSQSNVQAMVAALAGGGPRAEAVRPLLIAGGAPAFTAVAQAFDGLDEGGRRVALDIMDQAPCELSAPVYVTALIGKLEEQSRHAQGHLPQCGAFGGEALAQTLAKTDKTDRRLMPLLVSWLTVTDPSRAIKTFLPLMDEKTVGRRRLLRVALSQAARIPSASKAVRSALGDPASAAGGARRSAALAR